MPQLTWHVWGNAKNNFAAFWIFRTVRLWLILASTHWKLEQKGTVRFISLVLYPLKGRSTLQPNGGEAEECEETVVDEESKAMVTGERTDGYEAVLLNAEGHADDKDG